jgi:hypothetical protein
MQNGLYYNEAYCVLLPGRFILYCVTMHLDIPNRSMYKLFHSTLLPVMKWGPYGYGGYFR